MMHLAPSGLGLASPLVKQIIVLFEFKCFSRLPTDPDLRNEWITIIGQSRQDFWLPSKLSVVCSLHFEEDDLYYTEKGRRVIKKTAKPAKNLFVMPPSPETCLIVLEDEAGPSNIPEVNPLPGKSNGDHSVDDSDQDSLFDTPTESKLRKKLRKQQKLRIATKLKLKTLQQKHRRLQKRYNSLKNILKELKDKKCINCDTHS